MRAATCLLLALFSCITALAQDETSRLKELYQKEKFTEIISEAEKSTADWNAKSLYYIGMAYYRKADDNNALKYLDKALAKGPADADMHFYKGRVLFYKRSFPESIASINKAIEMLPNEPDFYAGKAGVLAASGDKDSAIHYYEKALTLPGCSPNIYISLAETYLDSEQHEKALNVYQLAIKNIKQGEEEHQMAYYNAGLIYTTTGKPREARQVFEEMINIYPNNYRAISKLIQQHHALEEYDKVKPLRNTLYKAYKEKKLPEEMEKMYCFDQFICEGKKVMAFEMFEELDENKTLFVKHHFYVLNDSAKVEYEVRSESSFAVRMGGKNSKYVLCLVRGGSFSTYWSYIFNDESSYADTKKAVINILKGASKPSARTITGN